ncbi:MAG: IPT/TIG domain-containing protein [Candidatus Omnitrophica bacterium]|nr:IPT/TIG domain-containing protein [Candidatus Omnitrophota bacterium]
MPHVSYISPYYGEVNTTTYMRGNNFDIKDASSKVEFYNTTTGVKTNAVIKSWTDTYISVTVPSISLGYYTVSVLNVNGQSNPVNFRIIRKPTVSITSPSVGAIVSSLGFTFKGKAQGMTSIKKEDVCVGVYDYARKKWTAYNAPVTSYDPLTKVWQYNVTADKITPNYRADLRVTAKDSEGFTTSKNTYVRVSSPPPAI